MASLWVGLAIGALLGVLALGTHFSEWTTPKSLGNILAPALVGLLFGYLATNPPGSSKTDSESNSSTNDIFNISSVDFHHGDGHSGSHSNDGGCDGGADGGGDCGGGV